MTEKPSLWKRVSSGQYVDINNLIEADLTIEDVNTSLNQIVRFTGHYKDKQPLTVAQHSMLAYNMVCIFEPDNEELKLAVLTHDFAESLIGDVASPIKQAMGITWYNFAKPIEKLFEKKFFGKTVNPELHDRVKLYDLAALDIERRVIWSSQYGKDKWPACPLNVGTVEDKHRLYAQVANKNWDLVSIWKHAYEKVHK